ncbi:hypothetical protein Kpol_284p4 [Vanderwaltozyma polyspora DSM 70294]|uniref:Conserved oligomeric Golgi complex subunit 4 n=1 Tax=Vanderwaltozyma polyspora (strain ATCC 22028 / DSM 70294 / BCRC 21397 / CBS 2163 / NBRC 10782 / NRRL Y-8283 / UCD 57-17) TaxID=436907 RepID=A7TT52_VANPO|nr:uncharacterized protein Kpol_284p4 [Vanderwaltozyma polyspora DSM 70294]EDO14557.1 hypothetical protein Kpol_284p4 [Vanderwaltozyma polyspora DSM 70294]
MDYLDNDTSWYNSVIDGQLSKNLSKYNQLLDKLSTDSQVSKLQKLLLDDSKQQIQNLNTFIIDSQSLNNKKIRKLELLRTDLTTTLSNYHNSLTNVSNSNNIAKNINFDISKIDNEKHLVNKTLSFLSDIKILKNNISIIFYALNEKNYELAAKSINEIRKLPPKIINSKFASKVVPSGEIPDEPSILVDRWCDELTQLFKDKFNTAAKTQDIEELTLMFKMFPMVGQNDLGLELYSKYVCDIIADESRKLMTSSGNNNLEESLKRPGFYSQVLLHLFKIVSTIINEHSKIIAGSYGKHHMSHIMEKVQKEADLQAGLILDIFMETKNLNHLVSDINEWNQLQQKIAQRDSLRRKNLNYNQNDNYQSDDDLANEISDIPDISINDISILINEFSQILQNWSMYSRFYSVRWNEFNDIETIVLTIPPSISEGQFTAKLQQDGFLNSFETIVLYHLNRSFNNSISIEELPSINDIIQQRTTVRKHKEVSSYPISSVLEDLILLIRKNLIVTVNTGQFTLLSHFLDQLAKFIQNQYLVKFLQNKFKTLQKRLNASLSLKLYSPKDEGAATNISQSSKSSSLLSHDYSSTKLSKLGFDFRGAAASAFTNIQSNIQAVVSDEDGVLSLHHYLIYVNTLYLNVVFIHKILSVEILEDNPRMMKDNFPFNNDAKELIEKIKACESLVKSQNEKLQKWSIKYLFENVIKPKINTMTNNLFVNGNENTYISGTDSFEDLSKINEFIQKWKSFIIPYQNVLYDDAFTELLTFIVNHIVQTIQQKIWTLHVNDLGATKLDRELSLFISTICDMNYMLREKFITLTQIVLIVGFDDDDFNQESNDVKEEIANSINWVLTTQERIRARNLKVDKRH